MPKKKTQQKTNSQTKPKKEPATSLKSLAKLKLYFINSNDFKRSASRIQTIYDCYLVEGQSFDVQGI